MVAELAEDRPYSGPIPRKKITEHIAVIGDKKKDVAWWARHLARLAPDHKHALIVSVDQAANIIASEESVSFISVDGWREKQRNKVDKLLLSVDSPIILLSYDVMSEDSRMVISLWAHYDPRLIVAVKPW
jgi:hypothetical protein